MEHPSSKLVAAAPAMLNLLKRLNEFFIGRDGPYSDIARDIRDVLEQAEDEYCYEEMNHDHSSNH